jgi:hypothetical protein
VKPLGHSHLLLKWCITATVVLPSLSLLWQYTGVDPQGIAAFVGFAVVFLVGGFVLLLEFPRATASLRCKMHLLNCIAAIFMATTVILSVLWIRSLYTADQFSYYDESHTFRRAVSLRGVLALSIVQYPASNDADRVRSSLPNGWNHQEMDAHSVKLLWKYMGFAYQRAPLPQLLLDMSEGKLLSFVVDERIAVVPYWFLVLCSGCYPLCVLIKFLRSHRRGRQNLCPTCNYDLRAHHPGDLCPECGAPVPAKNATIDQQRSRP